LNITKDIEIKIKKNQFNLEQTAPVSIFV
jgi:hypothetical protein